MIALTRAELATLLRRGWLKVTTPESTREFREKVGKSHTCRVKLFGKEYSLVVYTTRGEKSLIIRLS